MGTKRDEFPRRDEHGRVAGLADLLALTAAALVTSAGVLVLVDAVTALLGWGRFGDSTGWLALILPAWLFIVEELRAWRPVRGRLAVALSGGLVALALGVGTAALVAGAPPLVSGGVGAAVAAAAYAVYWFHGVRWLARREGSVS
ncbi:MAG: hypothetical protein FWJ70_11145 [Micromonosporaceae bacterium]|jgi:hypothetical protein